MKDGKWAKWSMNADGSDPKVIEGEADLLSHAARSVDLQVKQGALWLDDHKAPPVALYKYTQLGESAPVSEANWTPDHKRVYFQNCTLTGCHLWVVGADGKGAKKLAEGASPDWRP